MQNQTFFTIGYEGQNITDFIERLSEFDVNLLIDVRKNAISRKYGFSKTRLGNFCNESHIEYKHISELGIESSKRKDLSDFQSYQNLLESYEKELMNKSDAIDKIVELVKYKNAALMCFEADYNICHRSRLSKYISNITNMNVVHIGAKCMKKRKCLL